MITDEIRASIRARVAQAPRLTELQRAKLAILLGPVRRPLPRPAELLQAA